MPVTVSLTDRTWSASKPVGRSSCRARFAPFKCARKVVRRLHNHVCAANLPEGVDVPPAVTDALTTAAPEVLYAAAAAGVGLLGLIAWGIAKSGRSQSQHVAPGFTPKAAAAAVELPRENAVLVFGASGRTGAMLVNKLISSGRTVVAAVRSTEKASKIYAELGLKLGYQKDKKKGILVLEEGIDISDASTLKASLWKGVTQVVSTVGPVYTVSEGGRGYADGMTPERVDSVGVRNITAAAAESMVPATRGTATVLAISSAQDLTMWERLDDVIMGGKSSSSLQVDEDGSAVWSGELIVEGGGFCGTRTTLMDLDLSQYSGIALRVKGDGQTYKMNVKTADQANVPEETYQATFETIAGQWTDVTLPWHAFVPTKKARFNPQGKPLDAAKVKQFGLVLSRFEYNGFPNPCYKPGKFELAIQGGIKAYKDPAPQLVLVSSAGTERYARAAADKALLDNEIPIVKLNPGGILCYKYEGEAAVRSSGLLYSVVRPTGLKSSLEDLPEGLAVSKLESDQGDSISGILLREDVADTVAHVLGDANASGKTFEIRRGTGPECIGKSMEPADWQRLILKLAPDTKRAYVGLTPFPVPVPYVKQEDAAVVADEAAAARAWIAAWRAKQPVVATTNTTHATPPASTNKQAKTSGAAAANDSNAQVEGARAWIAAWKSRQSVQGGSNGSMESAEEVPANVQEARDWIRMWRVKQLEAQLPADLPANSKK